MSRPKTLREQLISVQTAIGEAEEMQAASQGDTSFTRARLDVLYKREKDLLRRMARANGTRPPVMGVDFSGMGYGQ